MLVDIVSTIDSDNKYKDNEHKHSISRLATCKANFPVSGDLTNVVVLAKNVETASLKNNFDIVIKHLDEDKKQSVVATLQSLIGSDETLKYIKNGRTQLFSKCMGTSAENVSRAKTVDLRAFLAGIFLFIVLTNDTNDRNKRKLKGGKDISNKFINDGFIEKFLDSDVKIEDLEGNNTVVVNEIINVDDKNSVAYPDSKVMPDPESHIEAARKICYPVYNDEYWTEFEIFPEKFYVRNLYFITLNYNNDYYVMLDTNHFDVMNVKEAYNLQLCSVPFVCEEFDPRDFASDSEKTAGDFHRILRAALSETYEEAESKGRISLQGRLDAAEQDLLRTLNINIFNPNGFNSFNPKSLDEYDEYIEYRISFAGRDFDGKLRSECVCNREFFCIVRNPLIGEFSFDPECRHKYTFLPISLLSKLKRCTLITATDVEKLYEDFYDKDAYWNSLAKYPAHNAIYMDSTDAIYQFAGLNIPYYVHDALRRNLQQIQREAKKLTSSDLLIKKEGTLFHIAIHNSYIHDKIETGCQIHDIFLKCMMVENIKYYRADNYEIVGVLNGTDFTSLLETMYAELAKIMHAKQIKLHVCCTALYGEYIFGRVGGLNSNSPSFIGENYEILLRMAEKTLLEAEQMGSDFTGILFGTKQQEDGILENKQFTFNPKHWSMQLPVYFNKNENDIKMYFIIGDETGDGKNVFDRADAHRFW